MADISEQQGDSSKTNSTCCNTGRFCRCLVTCVSSSLCLTVLFIAYTVAGAFLFQYVELEYEQSLRDEAQRVEGDPIRQVLVRHYGMTSSNLTSEISEAVRRLQAQIARSSRSSLWNSNRFDTSDTVSQWSFPGALLYVVSIITTVGCGNQIPMTTTGRLITLPYAAVGIPLTLYYLSRVGRDLAVLFRSFYQRVCCDVLCCKRCQRRQRRRIYSNVGLERSPDGASFTGAAKYRLASDRFYRSSHVYESIGENDIRLSVAESPLTANSSNLECKSLAKRHLVESKSDPTTHQVTTLPRAAERKLATRKSSLNDVEKCLKPETDARLKYSTTNFDDYQSAKHQGRKKTMRQLSAPAPRIAAESPGTDVTKGELSDVIRSLSSETDGQCKSTRYGHHGKAKATTPDGRYHVTGSGRRGSTVVSAVRRSQRRVKGTSGTSRRTSAAAVSRKHGKNDSTTGSRIPPVGSSSTVDKASSSLSRQDSAESFVTASNMTPLLSRNFFADYLSETIDESTTTSGLNQCPQRATSSATNWDLRRVADVERTDVNTMEVRADGTVYEDGSMHQLSVPVPVCLIVIGTYTLGGAALFSQLYGRQTGDWSAGAFTSFAALCLIGGWYPAPETETTTSVLGFGWPPDSRYVFVVWLLVGLTLIAMCLSLLKDRIKSAPCCTDCCRTDV